MKECWRTRMRDGPIPQKEIAKNFTQTLGEILKNSGFEDICYILKEATKCMEIYAKLKNWASLFRTRKFTSVDFKKDCYKTSGTFRSEPQRSFSVDTPLLLSDKHRYELTNLGVWSNEYNKTGTNKKFQFHVPVPECFVWHTVDDGNLKL